MIQALAPVQRPEDAVFAVPPPLGARALDRARDRLCAEDPLKCARLLRRLDQVQSLVSATPAIRSAVLARELNLSPSRLEDCFREFTGQTLGAWLQQCRLAHAAHLLRTTNLRIKEIADRAGYAHAPSFVRAFRAAYRAAPDRWRLTQ